jgi:flagellar L-ring protein precursor FlgH
MNRLNANKTQECACVFLVLALGGCAASAPIVHQPMTARAAPIPTQATGASLYSSATFRPLFEDARARHVGDVLTITISENNTASKKSSDDASRKTSLNASVPTIAGLPFKGLQGLGASATSSYSFAGAGDAAMTDTFSGSITVTVVEEFPNGNLLVSGEKQLAINHGNEFVRFSGVVSPNYIVKNTVTSTHVADAKLEFKQDGALNSAQTQGWLSKFFLSILPF